MIADSLGKANKSKNEESRLIRVCKVQIGELTMFYCSEGLKNLKT